jgi:DNA invertase Pin-like site-specific DNA recombinase
VEPSKNLKLASYMRSASAEWANVEGQRVRNRRLADTLGCEIKAEYIDAGVGSHEGGRWPEFERLLEQARGFDAVVVDDLCRLGRELPVLARNLRSLRNGGLRVRVSNQMKTLTPKELDLSLAVLLAVGDAFARP